MATTDLDPKLLANKIQYALDLALNEGTHYQENDSSRVRRLRLSGFPYCGLKWFLGLPKSTTKASFIGSGMKYFVTVGHALHSVMQDALNSVELRGIEVYADWECTSCKHLHPFCLKPKVCSECGHKKTIYREITMDSPPILGHIDTVFLITLKKPTKDFPEGRVFVPIDYKTTSLKALEGEGLPYSDNVQQLSAYTNEIRRLGRPTAPFAFLVYVPRDKPFAFQLKMVEVDFELEEVKRARYIARFNSAIKVSTVEQAMSLVDKRPCRKGPNKLYASCPHYGYCPGADHAADMQEKAAGIFEQVKNKLPLTLEET